MKKLFVGLLGFVVLVVALAALALLRFDSEALGARVIDTVNSQAGIELTAERFSLHPWRGLEMTEVQASGLVESGELTAEIELMRLSYQLLPLLRGELVIDEALFVAPDIVLLTRPAERKRQQEARRQRGERKTKKRDGSKTTSETPAGTAIENDTSRKPLRLSIERLAIENGRLGVRARGEERPSFRVEALNLALEDLTFDPQASSSTEAVRGQGRLATGPVLYGDVAAEGSAGQIRIRDGRAELAELNVFSANADLMIRELVIDLLQQPPSYRLFAAGGVDLNGVLGLDPADGFGRVALDLEAAGDSPEVEQMKGSGTLTLNDGAIPPFPSVVQIEELLGQPLLTGRQYQHTEVDFTLQGSKVLLAPFEVVSEDASIGGAGEIDLSGPVDLEVFVRLPRRSLETGEVSQEELASMEDDQGRVSIPFAITGTIEEPEVQLTWDGMKVLARDAAGTWAERALDEAKKRAAEWLRSQSEDKDDG